MRAAKLSVILLLAGLLTACGFKLRGSAELPGYKLPFTTIALSLAPTSEFYAQLKRNIEASSPGTRVVADSQEAEAILSVLGDTSEKIILSLNAAGRAREFQLVRQVQLQGACQCHRRPRPRRRSNTPMRRHGVGPTEYIPPAPSRCAAKSPSATTWCCPRNRKKPCSGATCRGDLVQQLMRRLAAAKLKPVKVAE
jgi:LPS-assembly lipoprotein